MDFILHLQTELRDRRLAGLDVQNTIKDCCWPIARGGLFGVFYERRMLTSPEKRVQQGRAELKSREASCDFSGTSSVPLLITDESRFLNSNLNQLEGGGGGGILKQNLRCQVFLLIFSAKRVVRRLVFLRSFFSFFGLFLYFFSFLCCPASERKLSLLVSALSPVNR